MGEPLHQQFGCSGRDHQHRHDQDRPNSFKTGHRRQ